MYVKITDIEKVNFIQKPKGFNEEINKKLESFTLKRKNKDDCFLSKLHHQSCFYPYIREFIKQGNFESTCNVYVSEDGYIFHLQMTGINKLIIDVFELLIMECYIDFLDSKNNFKPTRNEFANYEDAYNFMLKTFNKIDVDYIKYF
jgi:hypothetical protein